MRSVNTGHYNALTERIWCLSIRQLVRAKVNGPRGAGPYTCMFTTPKYTAEHSLQIYVLPVSLARARTAPGWG